jgi:hypothetical protein
MGDHPGAWLPVSGGPITHQELLAAALDELRLAERWRHVVTAAIDHHSFLGEVMLVFGAYPDIDDLIESGFFTPQQAAEFHAEAETSVLRHWPEAGRRWRHLEDFVHARCPIKEDLIEVLQAIDGATILASVDRCHVGLDRPQIDELLETLRAQAMPGARIELRCYPPVSEDRMWANLRIVGERRPDAPRLEMGDGLLAIARGLLDRLPPHGAVIDCWLPAAT